MKKHLIVIGMTLIVLVVGLSGCNELTETGGKISETVNPPNFVITSKQNREGYEGPDRVGYVDITVKNDGGSGKETVYVKVTQGSNEWTKSNSITLGNDESTTLNFRFPEIQFWTLDSWSFTAWVG